jgi:hypothetical protein
LKENANIALMKNKKANKVATKRLKQAAIYLNENQKEKFYDEISRALWGYLSDKLNIPLANLTKEEIQSSLSERSIDEVLINETMNILSTCEYARYAPSQGNDEMHDMYKQTIDTISLLEEKIKK